MTGPEDQSAPRELGLTNILASHGARDKLFEDGAAPLVSAELSSTKDGQVQTFQDAV